MAIKEFSASIEIGRAQGHNVAQLVGAWWKQVSQESQTAATPGKLYAIGNYVIEMTKNSLADGKSDGKVSATFDHEKITIVVDDFGSEEKQFNLNIGGDYGLKEVIEYADDFYIEAGGRFYEKDRRNLVEETDRSDLRVGSKVTFVKYITAPSVQEAQVQYHGRNFGERM